MLNLIWLLLTISFKFIIWLINQISVIKKECFTMAASMLNAPVTVQFSNWPIADGYIAFFNLPSPPSAYPMTGTAFSPFQMGNFMTRLRNTIWHAIVMGARLLQGQVAKNFYASIGQPEVWINCVWVIILRSADGFASNRIGAFVLRRTSRIPCWTSTSHQQQN